VHLVYHSRVYYTFLFCVEESSSQSEKKRSQTDIFSGSVDTVDKRKNIKKTFIFDEDTFEERFLKCVVCKDHYASVALNLTKSSRFLPCHHSFCQGCILQLFRTEAEYRQSLTPAIRGLPAAVTIICPTCQSNFISTEAGLKQLPADHRVAQLLDFVAHTDRYVLLRTV
jgi:hypothetical protein